jgi:Ca2+-binding RTX toxin-like protein
MRRALLLAVLVSGLLVAFAGVALADIIVCNGGRCEGTNRDDDISGTDQRDVIFALGGFDGVEAFGGNDEINGQNAGDHIHGGSGADTHNGGNGNDLLHETSSDETGRDVFNGGPDGDLIEGGLGGDILRGQAGDECPFADISFSFLVGDEGNDELYGGTGNDCLEGQEGTDQHFGGDDNDFINAVNDDTDFNTGQPPGTHDLVDCGSGFDSAIVNSDEDIVRGNCEDVEDVAATTTGTPPAQMSHPDQQQLREAFIQEYGLAPEPAG